MQATPSNRLEARAGHGEGWAAVSLSGVIDEHNGLTQITAQLADAEGLLIFLGGIRRINSVGVRDWVLWLNPLRKRYKTLTLVDCPTAIMNEINLVKNFAQGMIVTTFEAPYYCDRCDTESGHTLDARDMVRDTVRTAPKFPCSKPACDNGLDDDPESYFAFLEDQLALTPPADLSATIQAAREALGGSVNVLSLTANGDAPKPAPRNALIQLGQSSAAVPSLLVGVPKGTPSQGLAPTFQPPPTPETDWVFVASLLAMLVALGVLIYLILTMSPE
jgi:hypothetical protein